MKKSLLSLAAVAAGAMLLSNTAQAQTLTEWQDAAVNEINRAPMRASYFA